MEPPAKSPTGPPRPPRESAKANQDILEVSVIAINSSMLMTPKEDLLRLALIAGCNDYLNCTNFGLFSFYTHGEAGKQRVLRILDIFKEEKITTSLKCLEYLFYSIIICSSTSLQRLIVENVLASGLYADRLTPLIKKYSTPEFSSQEGKKFVYCFIDILKLRLGIVGSNTGMFEQLAEYLDGKMLLEEGQDFHVFFRWLLPSRENP